MDGTEDYAQLWKLAAEAIGAGDLEEAGRLVLRTPLLPGLRRQLQLTFPRLPPEYIDDALAEAVSETFVRLQGGKHIDPVKVGGYIFNAARYIATKISQDLAQRHQFLDVETTPYDPDLAGVHGLGELTEHSENRRAALLYLEQVIDLLPSSDNPKAVLKVRISGALNGDWLSDGEVAEILGRERSSISSWWRRGLIDLREHLAERGVTRESLLATVDELSSVGEDEGEEDNEEQEEEDDD